MTQVGMPTTAHQSDSPLANRPRLQRVDLMRVNLFFLVVIVHAIGTINISEDSQRGMGMLSMLNHFARYGFVFITGFVLFLGYHGRGQSPINFWRRRFGLVVLPYLVWTVVYTVTNAWLLSEEPMPGLGALARDSLEHAVYGNAKYQLYFLLISMQIYLVFPLLSAIVHRTTGHHGKLLAAAAAIQVGMFFLLTCPNCSFSPQGTSILAHTWKTLPVYILFLVGGALAAVHFARFDAWVGDHTRAIVVAALAVGIITVAFYLAISGGGEISARATSGANPVYLPWFLAGTALVYIASTALTDRRKNSTGRLAHLVSILSLGAFGVFAVHPLIIDLIHKSGFVGWLYDAFPGSAFPRSLLLALTTIIASLCVVEIMLRLPFSKTLTARDRIPIRQPRVDSDASPHSGHIA